MVQPTFTPDRLTWDEILASARDLSFRAQADSLAAQVAYYQAQVVLTAAQLDDLYVHQLAGRMAAGSFPLPAA